MAITIDDTTGATVAIPAYTFRRQALLRITGNRAWVNFNTPAVVGECEYIDAGDCLRFWGDRQTADVYLVTDSGATATGYVVEGATNMEIAPGSAKSETGSSIVTIADPDGDLIDVQNPFPVDGDSVYAKDIWVEQSSTVGFTGTITDLFDNLHTVIVNSSATDPKEILVHFNRSTIFQSISLGAYSGDFSNVKLLALVSGGIEIPLVDESADNTKYTSRIFELPVVGLNALKLQFHTTDTVTLSNLFIPKIRGVVSRIQGERDDGDFVVIGATNNDNLRVSVQEYGDTPAIDAFDRLRTSEPFTLFDSKQLHDKQPLFWDEEIGGSATSVHSSANSEVKMSVTADSGDYVIRQTKQRFNYQPGKSQEILMTFHSPQATGITNRIGLFDDDGTGDNLTPNNGIFFECDGGLSWNIAKDGAITETIEQASWNVDPLDGTGNSGKTLDMTAAQIMIMDFEWLGVGRVRVGFVIDGLIFYCHYFNHANDSTFSSVYMSTPNLPLRYSIETDGTTASHLDHICSTVMSEGGVEKTGVLRAVDNGTSYITAMGTGTSYAMLGVRLKAAYDDITVIPENISLIAGSNDDFRWQVQINPTVTGTFTYNDLTNSAVQWANGTAKPTVTADGIIIGSGYASKSSKQTDSDLNTALRIGSTIAGVQDTLVLVVTPISSNLSALSAMTFRELL